MPRPPGTTPCLASASGWNRSRRDLGVSGHRLGEHRHRVHQLLEVRNRRSRGKHETEWPSNQRLRVMLRYHVKVAVSIGCTAAVLEPNGDVLPTTIRTRTSKLKLRADVGSSPDRGGAKKTN